MSESVNYVTNEQGEKVGVLLDLATYQRLIAPLESDPEILVDLCVEELQALAESTLAPTAQLQLNNLLDRQAENQLSDDETATLDRLLAQIDRLNILKTRARNTLRQFSFDANQAARETSNEITTTVYLKDGETVQVKLTELDNYLKANQEKIEPRKVKAKRSQIKKTTC